MGATTYDIDNSQNPHAVAPRLRPRRHSGPPQPVSQTFTRFQSPCSPAGRAGLRKQRDQKEEPVADSEQVLDIPVRRHVLTSERPFQVVLDGIYDGISQPDIGVLFATLAASTSLDGVRRAGQARAGQRWPDAVPAPRRLTHVLALDPQARDRAARRLVCLIAWKPGHHGADDPPPARGRIRRPGHHPHPGSCRAAEPRWPTTPSPARSRPTMNAAASRVAQRLDTEVLSLLHHATGIPATAPPGAAAPSPSAERTPRLPMITKPRPGHDRHPEGGTGHHLNRTACTQAAVQADRRCISRAVSGFSPAYQPTRCDRLPQPARPRHAGPAERRGAVADGRDSTRPERWRPRTDRPYRLPTTGGVVIMKAISMSPRSGQRTASSNATGTA